MNNYNEDNEENEERVWSLPEFHDKKRFDDMYSKAKQEYPNEIDYIFYI